MGVGPCAHRGASIHQRVIVPIVVFLGILVGGPRAILSQRASSVESESTSQGGHFNVSLPAHFPHGVVVGDECMSGATSDDGVVVGNVSHGYPNALDVVSISGSTPLVVFEVEVQHTKLTCWSSP